jgi:hypothetical protein
MGVVVVAAGMIREIRRAKAKLPHATQVVESVELADFDPVRFEREPTNGDRQMHDVRLGCATARRCRTPTLRGCSEPG